MCGDLPLCVAPVWCSGLISGLCGTWFGSVPSHYLKQQHPHQSILSWVITCSLRYEDSYVIACSLSCFKAGHYKQKHVFSCTSGKKTSKHKFKCLFCYTSSICISRLNSVNAVSQKMIFPPLTYTKLFSYPPLSFIHIYILKVFTDGLFVHSHWFSHYYL